jgi:hypothetical protein
MPLPVSARRVGEWALRVLSLALLVVILMRAWTPSSDAGRSESVRQSGIVRALPGWSQSAPARVHLALDSAIAPEERDWIAAIERAGTSVTWSSSRIVPLAATLSRVADPSGGFEFAASGTAHDAMLVRDPVGLIDTVIAGPAGIRVQIPGTATRVGASAGSSTAWAAYHDTVIFKRLLVEGAASWETKFTIAALAERGWKVDALTHLAPGVDVREGKPVTPDTSRYAAVIAVDSTASLVSGGAAAFVRSGGGLVTLHDASTIGPHAATSVVLERRPDGDVRASRSGEGRVIRVGYKDLWRERMADDDSIPDPVAAHRAWLARVVASVAYAPRIAVIADSGADPAPLADMVDRIGAPTRSLESASPLRSEVPSSVLFGILLVSLLLELASRRLRGAR